METCTRNALLRHPRLERLLGLKAILTQEAVQIFTLEPAVAPWPQAISVDQLFVGPLPHRVGMNMEEMSYLSSGQHS